MIELVDGFWLNPDKVTVVKSISAKKCSLWVKGQGAMDGFVLDYPAEEIIDLLHDALYGEEEEDEEEDGDEED